MGKTKDVVVNGDGTCTFTFKDDACGEGGIFDPGANEVGLKIEGMGKASMLLSHYFFPLMKKNGIPVHYIDMDINAGTMLGVHLDIFPVEFIWRAKAYGSFCRTYDVIQGLPLNGLVEATLKSDPLGDPRINKEALVTLDKMTPQQYDKCDEYIRKIAAVLKAEFDKHGYELIDFKVEFGADKDGNVMLADEISGGIWRLFKDGKAVDPIECAKTFCPEYY